MKRISIVLVSLVYMLPGVLAVLAHTNALDALKTVDTPDVTYSAYADADTVSEEGAPYLVMLETPVKK